MARSAVTAGVDSVVLIGRRAAVVHLGRYFVLVDAGPRGVLIVVHVGGKWRRFSRLA